MYLPPGKLPVEILERLIRTYTTSIHGVVVGASIGEDAAAINYGDKYLLATTDPITFVTEDIGTYAVFVNSNDIAPIVIGTMLGEVEKNLLITTAGARPEDDILLSKAIAIEGSSIMAREKGEELANVFGEKFMRSCRKLAEEPGISVPMFARDEIARILGKA